MMIKTNEGPFSSLKKTIDLAIRDESQKLKEIYYGKLFIYDDNYLGTVSDFSFHPFVSNLNTIRYLIDIEYINIKEKCVTMSLTEYDFDNFVNFFDDMDTFTLYLEAKENEKL